MKKILIGIAACLVVFGVAVANGGNPKSPADYNGLTKGNPNVNHLYLYEKNPATWEIVPDGAWAKMTYNLSKETVVFNGHGLESAVEYALIKYVDPWPGTGLEVVALGTADEYGDLHLSADYQVESGVKYWLVLANDIGIKADSTMYMSAWNPTEYLFEYNLTP